MNPLGFYPLCSVVEGFCLAGCHGRPVGAGGDGVCVVLHAEEESEQQAGHQQLLPVEAGADPRPHSTEVPGELQRPQVAHRAGEEPPQLGLTRVGMILGGREGVKLGWFENRCTCHAEEAVLR